jgi:TRAP-type C4-dicarboxylate transport system substrate-binding protein
MTKAGAGYMYLPAIVHMNLDYWNRIPSDIQEILLESSREAAQFMRNEKIKEDVRILAYFKQIGIEVLEVDPEPFQAATISVWDSVKDYVGADFYTQWLRVVEEAKKELGL